MTEAVIGETSFADLVPYIKRNVVHELTENYPGVKVAEGFVPTLANTVEVTGTKFIMIIDEWDAPIREGKDDPKIQREYLDFDGMSKTIAELLGGIDVPVDTNGFANDLVTFRDRDDVLTLLIHLGYLAYEKETGTVHIPNEEIRLEFAKSVRKVKRNETIQRVCESDQLIADTVQGNADAVAAQIEKIHAEETAPLFYR